MRLPVMPMLGLHKVEICTAFLIVILSCAAAAQPAPKFHFEAPPDWKKETIKFPLGFTPEIKYQGLEELRFSPGMFDRGADSYFSYTFFWWLEGKQAFSPHTLEGVLTTYFRGLSKQVGTARKLAIDTSKISAQVTEIKQSPTGNSLYKSIYHAEIHTYDPFNKGEELSLNAEIAVLDRKDLSKTIVTFCISPRDYGAPMWSQLREIRDSLTIE